MWFNFFVTHICSYSYSVTDKTNKRSDAWSYLPCPIRPINQKLDRFFTRPFVPACRPQLLCVSTQGRLSPLAGRPRRLSRNLASTLGHRMPPTRPPCRGMICCTHHVIKMAYISSNLSIQHPEASLSITVVVLNGHVHFHQLI